MSGGARRPGEGAPAPTTPCPAHPVRAARSSCVVCGRPLCDLCLGQIDADHYCPAHFIEVEERIRAQSYSLPPLPSPVTAPEILLGVWAVAGAIAPWMSWYRTVVRIEQPAPAVQVIEEVGWSAGGIAALASITLLAAGVTLGVMVLSRVVRPRWIPKAAVAQASVPLGAAAAVLTGIRLATRYENLGTGIYVAVTAAVMVAFLGRRLTERQTESPRH